MILFPMFVNMLFYVSTIIICTVAATLYVRFSFKRAGSLYKNVSMLLISFLAYTVFEMFVTFFTELQITKELFYALTTLSDIAYFVVIVEWIATIVIVSGNPYIIKVRGFAFYTIVYGISVDGLNLISKFSPYKFGMTSKEISNILLYMNCIFDVTVIIIGVIFAIYSLLKMKGEKQGKWVCMFSICLIVYMIYITNWDIISCLDEVPNNILFASFDPAHIFAIVMCALTLYMVAKKDELRTGYYIPEVLGVSDRKEVAWEILAKEYKLTSRELELLGFIYSGASNPDIAEKMYISESTVKQHLTHIYKKLNVKNRYELIQKIKI